MIAALSRHLARSGLGRAWPSSIRGVLVVVVLVLGLGPAIVGCKKPPPLRGAVEIAVSGQAGCARLSDGTVACWGASVGDGSGKTRRTAVKTKGLADVAKIVAGESHHCALRTKGTVTCWGPNYDGQCGQEKSRFHLKEPKDVP